MYLVYLLLYSSETVREILTSERLELIYCNADYHIAFALLNFKFHHQAFFWLQSNLRMNSLPLIVIMLITMLIFEKSKKN